MENNILLSFKPLSQDEIIKIEEFRKAKHTAILVILFSDIVGSTNAAEKLGEQIFSRLRHIHDELFKSIVCRDNAGVIIKQIGDSFLCVFAEPSTAVLRSIEFQEAIKSNKVNLSEKGYTLTVRIGIHVGQVAVENSLVVDIFGRHVNRASRIEALASGGQILTSQSIWDNAVGWLKDHNEKQIGWNSYGKVKLKGIDEKIEIYEFYLRGVSTPSMPIEIFRQRRKKNFGIILSAIILIILITFLVNKIVKNNSEKEIASEKKSYYLQFDFSELQPMDKYFIDTIKLKENLTQQSNAILYPDSIITESDFMQLANKRGLLYIRHDNFDIDHWKENAKYWIALDLSGEIYIKAHILEKLKSEDNFVKMKSVVNNDSIQLEIRLNMHFPANQNVSKVNDRIVSIENIERDFRGVLLDELADSRIMKLQGHVISFENNIVLFKLNPSTKIIKGASIKINRNYSGKVGVNNWLKDIQEEIDFLKDKPDFNTELKNAIEKYDAIKGDTMLPNGYSRGENIKGVGKILEIYDSTATAKFDKMGTVPWDVPKEGDLVWLTH